MIEFLKHLLRYIPGDILLLWDRLLAHKSKITHQFIQAHLKRTAVIKLLVGLAGLGNDVDSRTPDPKAGDVRTVDQAELSFTLISSLRCLWL